MKIWLTTGTSSMEKIHRHQNTQKKACNCFLVLWCCNFLQTLLIIFSVILGWWQYINHKSVEITNKMQPCNSIYYSKIYWRRNMFQAAHRSSSGAPNCICCLWFIYPCGDRPLSRLGGKYYLTAILIWRYKHEICRVFHNVLKHIYSKFPPF